VGNDVAFDVTLLMIVPLLALAAFLAQSHVRGISNMAHLAPVYVVAALAFIAHAVRKLVKAGARLDNLKAGYDAERCRPRA